MFRLRLKARDCISCGICVDVCQPRAISMRTKSLRSVEGPQLSFLALGPFGRGGRRVGQLMTFPYLSRPELCDGCGLCVRECPCAALELSIGEWIAEPEPGSSENGLAEGRG
jgi:ferredoxin